jgi:cGMP-dependent protein kinase 1
MMDIDRLDAVTQAMTPCALEAYSYIITEGESGSYFYVSAEGTFEVLKEGKVIKSFSEGVVFGELAILYKAKRFASIRRE